MSDGKLAISSTPNQVCHCYVLENGVLENGQCKPSRSIDFAEREILINLTVLLSRIGTHLLGKMSTTVKHS